MNIKDIVWINIKKLKKRTKRALFLIIPVGILMTLSVIISSQISNIQTAIDSTVFGTISEQNTLIQVESESNNENSSSGNTFGGGMNFGSSGFESNQFSSTDVSVLLGIDNIEAATLMAEIPVENISTEDLFDDIEININSFIGLDSEIAGLYTDEDFTYTEGEAIPIILNASDFTVTTEDWGEDGTIELTMPSGESEDRSSPAERMSAFSSEAIDYDKDELIGKTITISVGGLEDLQNYEITMGDNGPVMTQLSEEEIAEQEEERKETISKYWDYDAISQKLEYTFVVVGVIESSSNRDSYVPADFADILMNDYISNQLNALIVDPEEVDTDVLNADFTGLTYDGYELSNSGVGMMGQMVNRMREGMGMPGEGSDDSEGKTFSMSDSISIPGLVIEVDDDDNVVGVYTDTEVYSEAEIYASTIAVKVDDESNREQVIEDINDAGYAVQDNSNSGIFGELQSTLTSVSTGLMIAFIVIVAGVVVLTMSKMVSESTKEIGIFRAIGMKKGNISLMFILQALMYVAIGYLAGLILGSLLNIGISGIVADWFNNFTESTVSQAYGVIQESDTSIFMNINWFAVEIYTLLLLGISLLVSFLPARSASNISPVVAINNE
jgi:ABC-type antimicrobial peptide transport system permease subunit